MPLSPATERELIHTRRIECHGYRRRDGLWDIEGRLLDTKAHAFENDWRGVVAPGEAVHDMSIRLTVDDEFVVRGVEAVTDASPYSICPEVAPTLRALEGAKIGRGWSRALRRLVGGRDGCTHLTELLGRMATACFQTIYPYRAAHQRVAPVADARPPLLNSCHAYRDDGPVIAKHYPEFRAAAGDE